MIAAVTLAVHAALSGRYGFHRDELYYLACGRHPAWGYVDQPPITPMVARGLTAVFGTHLWPLRVFAGAVHAATVVVTARIATSLGAKRAATILAAATTAVCPYFVGSTSLFNTNGIDLLVWAIATLLIVHLLQGGDQRGWLALGVVIGIGLENKWLLVTLAIGLLVGLMATRDGRRHLRSPWLWGGVAVAIAIWLPNLIWQATHHWPTLEFTRNNNAAVRADKGRLGFVTDQFTYLAPTVIVAAFGARWLWRRLVLRPLTVAVATVYLIEIVVGGKGYYVAGTWPLLFAAGAIAIAGEAERLARPVTTAVAVTALVSAPIAAPVLPLGLYKSSHASAINEELTEEVGWPELADQVAAVYKSLPVAQRRTATVLTRSYGEAGALQLYGPDRGLPRAAVLSGHNSYDDWWPDDEPTGVTILVVAHGDPLERPFSGCRTVGHVDNERHFDNKSRGLAVEVCRKPPLPPAQLRRAVRQRA